MLDDVQSSIILKKSLCCIISENVAMIILIVLDAENANNEIIHTMWLKE